MEIVKDDTDPQSGLLSLAPLIDLIGKDVDTVRQLIGELSAAGYI